MNKENVYSPFEEYKKVFFPEEEDKFLYDNPEQFGKALARRHLDMVREAVKEWQQEKRKASRGKSPKKPSESRSKRK